MDCLHEQSGTFFDLDTSSIYALGKNHDGDFSAFSTKAVQRYRKD